MSQFPYSIPSREDILGILRTASEPQDAASVAAALQVGPDEMEGLTRRLNAMERDGQIVLERSGFYKLSHAPNFISGKVSGHRDGFGFLIQDEGGDDLFLSEQEMQKVLHGDRVKARVTGTDSVNSWPT